MASACSCVCAVSLTVGGITLLDRKPPDKALAQAPSTTDEFLIGSWRSFYDESILSYEEQLKDCAESGINWQNNPLSVVSNEKILYDANFTWEEMERMYAKYNTYYSASAKGERMTTEAANALVEEMTTNDRSHCIAYYVKDEPSAAAFTGVAELYLDILKKDPSRFPFVNLFPNYAGATNLGGSYKDYVSNWVKTVGQDNLEYLAYDHYPFTAFEKVRSSYFSDLETIRATAYENGKLKTVACTQMGYWNGMVFPTPDMARWNVNSFLAYGIKAITHFCWVAPAYVSPADGGEGMMDFVVNTDGTKTALYEPMRKVNWQTRQLGSLLMQMDVAHAYHAGTVAQGAEALPKNFLLQPSNSSDNLVFSLAYGKNDKDIYVMVFNNETDGEEKTYNVNVDLSSGIKSLTRYGTDEFDETPDLFAPLPALKETEVDISGGNFSVSMKPGDLILFKLNGDVTIKEPLRKPELSIDSGTYIGEQKLEITSMDPGTEIYYTTDGSYPDYTSTRYTGPITIGHGRDFGQYSIKAISIRGNEISDAISAEYFIVDGSENVAFGKNVTFTGETQSVFGSAKPDSITNDFFDPYNVYGSVANKPCFAIVDLGKEYYIDRLVVKAFHDWRFSDVVLQTALDEDFTSGVYTVFNNDSDNSVGEGAGNDGVYVENPGGGHEFKFEPRKVRYIRFHNFSENGRDNYSFWEEIQAYTAYSEGTELLNSTDWQVTGGGNWVYSDGTVSQTGEFDKSSWDRSYTYTAKKFKNFMIEGKFKMAVNDPSAWGYVGFGLYKPEINYTQSSYDKGFYAVVEPRGRALLWNGKKPELGRDDANIVGFSLNSEFTLRVISVDDTISVSVNGKPVMYERNAIFDREAGYISIHGGLIPVSVSSVRITEFDDSVKPLPYEDCIKEGEESRFAVDRFTAKSDVIKQLPTYATAKTVDGKEYQLEVEWGCQSYDSSIVGYSSFEGKFKNLPKGLVNFYDVKAKMNVFVKPELDTIELERLIALGKSLNKDNFTEESYKEIDLKIKAAEAMLANPYLVQSDLGVGVFQLFDAIYKYAVSTVDKSGLNAKIAEAEKLLQSDLTETGANKINIALASAKSVSESTISTADDVQVAMDSLDKAMNSQIRLVDEVKVNSKIVAIYKTPKKYNPAVFGGIGVSFGIVAAAAIIVFGKKRKKN